MTKAEYIKSLQTHVGKNIKGRIAGFGAWLNGKVCLVSDQGDLEMEFVVRDEMLNPMGSIHGGAVAAIIDEILGFQLFLKAADNTAYVSMTMNIDFMRAAKSGDTIRAIPKVVRIGRKSANVTCVLCCKDGKIIAQASSNFMQIS